jgi:hypothetical protein
MCGYALPQNDSVNKVHTEITEWKPWGLVRGLACFVTMNINTILSDLQKSWNNNKN